MKDPFCYIPPTTKTAPKHAVFRMGEADASLAIVSALDMGNNLDCEARFDAINAACKHFADSVEAAAPQSADATTAIRCIRLARMRANEEAASGRPTAWRESLTDARMWASAAVALDDTDKPDVPFVPRFREQEVTP